jgi:flagellar hook-length control protein FliK
MSVTPAIPVAAAAPQTHAAAVDPLDSTAGAQPAGTDFAAVLMQQMGLPPQSRSGDLAAMLTDEAAKAGEPAATATDPATDPAAILPTLPALPALAVALPVAALPVAPATLVATPRTDTSATQATVLVQSAQTSVPATLSVEAPALAPQSAAPLPVAAKTDPGPAATAATVPTPGRQVEPAFLAAQEHATGETTASALARTEPSLPPATLDAVAQARMADSLARIEHRAEAPALRVDTPVSARGWDDEVGQKLVWMVNRNESRAELTLTPPHLGKVEVTISTSGDQTTALFVSASQTARDALESALPRLREMLAEAGITLGQASVNAESPQRGNDDGRDGARPGRESSAATATPSAAAGPWLGRGSGLIDTFA